MGNYARGGVSGLGLLVALASCADLEFRAYAGYMQAEMTGDVGLASSGLPNVVTATVDVEDALGTDEEGSIYVRTEFEMGIVRVTGSAFQYESGGPGVLLADFGNIPAGVAVDTDMEVNVIKGAVTFDVIDFGYLRLSPGVAVDYFDVDTTVTAVGFGISERLEVDVPVPMPILQAEVDIGPVAVTAEGGGMAINYSDVKGTYWDFEGMVRWKALSFFEAFAGYRWIHVDSDGTASGQDYDADVNLRGWFVGGGLTF